LSENIIWDYRAFGVYKEQKEGLSTTRYTVNGQTRSIAYDAENRPLTVRDGAGSNWKGNNHYRSN
jgi:hypothetical protein